MIKMMVPVMIAAAIPTATPIPRSLLPTESEFDGEDVGTGKNLDVATTIVDESPGLGVGASVLGSTDFGFAYSGEPGKSIWSENCHMILIGWAHMVIGPVTVVVVKLEE